MHEQIAGILGDREREALLRWIAGQATEDPFALLVAAGRLLRAPVPRPLRRIAERVLRHLPSPLALRRLEAEADRGVTRLERWVQRRDLGDPALLIALRDDLESLSVSLSAFLLHADLDTPHQPTHHDDPAPRTTRRWSRLGRFRRHLQRALAAIDERLEDLAPELRHTATAPPDAELLERLEMVGANGTPWGEVATAALLSA